MGEHIHAPESALDSFKLGTCENFTYAVRTEDYTELERRFPNGYPWSLGVPSLWFRFPWSIEDTRVPLAEISDAEYREVLEARWRAVVDTGTTPKGALVFSTDGPYWPDDPEFHQSKNVGHIAGFNVFTSCVYTLPPISTVRNGVWRLDTSKAQAARSDNESNVRRAKIFGVKATRTPDGGLEIARLILRCAGCDITYSWDRKEVHDALASGYASVEAASKDVAFIHEWAGFTMETDEGDEAAATA